MNLDFLTIHCSKTQPSFILSAEHIKEWHLKDNGWSRVGYTDLILRGGNLVNLVPFDQDNIVDYDEMTWGVKGKNSVSRHLCLEGGLGHQGELSSPLETLPGIEEALEVYLKYTILRHPKVKIAGHYQFDDNKYFCPGFDVVKYCRNIGIADRNINL